MSFIPFFSSAVIKTADRLAIGDLGTIPNPDRLAIGNWVAIPNPDRLAIGNLGTIPNADRLAIAQQWAIKNVIRLRSLEASFGVILDFEVDDLAEAQGAQADAVAALRQSSHVPRMPRRHSRK